MNLLKDKVALVTGGSSGLGRHIAEALVQRGCLVVIAARGKKALDDTAKAMSTPSKVTPLVVDVTKAESVNELMRDVIHRHGRLDVLVNNVGKSDRGRLEETSVERFRELFELNFFSMARCTQAALPHLKVSRGHVVNIGSLSSKVATRYMGAYPASKFAMAAYTQQLRFELREHGIHVLLVCPGPIARDDAGRRYPQQGENVPEQAIRPGGGAKLRTICPILLARRIVRAVERGQTELIVPARARALLSIAPLAPRIGDWFVRRKTPP